MDELENYSFEENLCQLLVDYKDDIDLSIGSERTFDEMNKLCIKIKESCEIMHKNYTEFRNQINTADSFVPLYIKHISDLSFQINKKRFLISNESDDMLSNKPHLCINGDDIIKLGLTNAWDANSLYREILENVIFVNLDDILTNGVAIIYCGVSYRSDRTKITDDDIINVFL